MYTCGDGFQYMRPWLTSDMNEVIGIVAPNRDQILVTFGDNSVVLLDVPSLTVVDLLPGDWVHAQAGNISFSHVDEPAENGFVYVGTTKGYIFVLDTSTRVSIRVCEYSLTPLDLGIPSSVSMAISELQICPKDDKYIGVGLSGPNKESGAVVVFNFLKHKVKTNHACAAVSTGAWSHTGDVLYAGKCLA